MKKIVLYINLILIFFPAFSLTYPFTGIYFQSRILGLPLLFIYFYLKRERLTKDLLILVLPLLVSIIVPILGLLSDRSFTFIDLGYILSFLYLILFAQIMGKNLNLFINFVKLFTTANIVYSLIQTIVMNIGLDRIAMIHSNLPSQEISGYVLPPSILPYTYRFSGLFNESSPLMFYICCSYIFILEIDSKYQSKNTSILQLLTLLTILLSGAKFSYAFLIIYFILKAVSLIKDKNFRRLLAISLLIFSTYFFINYYSAIVIALSDNLPAFGERQSKLENSLISLSQLDVIGNGFLPSTTGEAGGLDAITIVIGAYGPLFGITILISFLAYILLSKAKNKAIFIAIYLLGLSSNGSFLISQYTLFVTMIYIINKQDDSKIKLFNEEEYKPIFINNMVLKNKKLY